MKKKFKKVLMAAMLLPAISFGLASCSNHAQEQKKVKLNNYEENSIMPLAATFSKEDIENYAKSKMNDASYNYSVVSPSDYEAYSNGLDFNVYEMVYNFYKIDESVYSDRSDADPMLNHGLWIEGETIGFFSWSIGYIYVLDSEATKEYLAKGGLTSDMAYIYTFEDELFSCVDALQSEYSSTIQNYITNYTYVNNEASIIIPKTNFVTNEFTSSYSDAFGMYRYKIGDTDLPKLYIPTTKVNVDNIISFNEIKSHITAYDQTEGDITDRIKFLNNSYILDSEGKIAVGNYKYTVEVSDSAGNTSTATGLIIVEDTTKPVIETTNKEVVYTQTLTELELKGLFTISDNYNSIEELEVTYDLDGYLNNAAIKGEHRITVEVRDTSGNRNSATAVINVIDNIKPILKVPSLSLNSTAVVTYDDIKALCSAVDGYDGVINFSLTDNDSMIKNYSTGVYNWTITATDSSNNINVQNFTINVIDTDMPQIIFDASYFFYTSKEEMLTKETLTLMLLSLEEVEGDINNNNIETIVSDYYLSPYEEGEYEMSVFLTSGEEIKNKIIVTDQNATESVKGFNFWEASWDLYIKNWKDFNHWNYSHWVTIIGGLLLIIGCCIVGSKKKK